MYAILVRRYVFSLQLKCRWLAHAHFKSLRTLAFQIFRREKRVNLFVIPVSTKTFMAPELKLQKSYQAQTTYAMLTFSVFESVTFAQRLKNPSNIASSPTTM